MSTLTSASEAARRELGTGFAGQLIGPEDAGYEQARAVYNSMIDKRPALIARCAGPDDVARVVDFVRDRGLDLAVRGGGHNGAGLGTCDDGVVADLSLLRDVQVIRKRVPCAWAAAPPGPTWTGPRTNTGSPCRAGLSLPPVSVGSPSAAAWAT
jgi:hypothetical protein